MKKRPEAPRCGWCGETGPTAYRVGVWYHQKCFAAWWTDGREPGRRLLLLARKAFDRAERLTLRRLELPNPSLGR